MGFSKLSVTIPDEIYQELRKIAAKKRIKVSHLVTDALPEKTRRMKEETPLQTINEVFEDLEVLKEQGRMAGTIAESADLEELPW
jgi:rRNA-processing protein FCF1